MCSRHVHSVIVFRWTGDVANSFLNLPSRWGQPSSQSLSWLVRRPAVAENLGTIARGRFTVRFPEQKLRDKLGKYPSPENCPELKPPLPNAELGDKGYLDSGVKKSDSRSVAMLCRQWFVPLLWAYFHSCKNSTTALPLAGRLSDPRDKAQFDRANETIAWRGDVIKLL